jgi:hypothetical protein
MSIQKKSLISTLQSAKKANLAKESVSSDVSKSAVKASPSFSKMKPSTKASFKGGLKSSATIKLVKK